MRSFNTEITTILSKKSGKASREKTSISLTKGSTYQTVELIAGWMKSIDILTESRTEIEQVNFDEVDRNKIPHVNFI